jgi:hypothetical protein
MKWISVKESLPPFDMDVLVYVDHVVNRATGQTNMKIGRLYERMVGFDESEESKGDRIRWTITDTPLFWCHLPKNPEGSHGAECKTIIINSKSYITSERYGYQCPDSCLIRGSNKK